MAEEREGTGTTGEPAGASVSGANASSIVDKRKARLAILNEPTDYSKNANRLSNVRWSIGEEPYPDVPGTDGSIGGHYIENAEDAREGEWVNVKVEVTEHPDPGPNQRNELHGGVELRMPCFRCGRNVHVAAEKTAKEVLEAAGYRLNERVANQDMTVVACACPNGHVMQLRGDFVERLVIRD